jgi:transposase
MKGKTSLEERVRIIEMAAGGKTSKEIAQEMGLSISTVKKWRRRHREGGRQGLASKIGRPRKGALSSFPGKMREVLKSWRKKHPGWGPKTLRAELSKHPAFEGQTLPSASSIGRYLKEQGLSQRYEPHHDLPQPKYQPAERPHQIWEMDARGYAYVPDIGVISLINLNDRLTHARLTSYPCWVGNKRCQRHPNTQDYQTVLRLTFTRWGLPERLQVDHDSVFHDNTSQSPFPTRFHLWLIALGIDLTFSRHRRPTDQGMTERSHQLWAAQCLQGQTYMAWEDLFDNLLRRCDFLNYDLPCASLDNLPPLIAFPQAVHSGRPYRPEHEADLLDLSRVWNYLSSGHWFRLSSKDFTFSLGRQVYYLGRPWQHTQLDISFDPLSRCLLCHDDTGTLIAQLPIKNISIDTLMGEALAYAHLPFFQLALPFDWPDQNRLRLSETFGLRLIET